MRGGVVTTLDSGVIASGQRVDLRVKRLSDAANDYAWRRDPVLARYDAARPTSLTYEEFLATFTEELLHPQPFRRTFAVVDHNEVHIGNVMYYNIDLQRREAELGITIGNPAYWGRGYGSEAVSLLVDHVFTVSSLTRLYLHTLDWNVRAQRAFESAGFRDCGRARRNQHRFHVMELRREWRYAREYGRRAVPRG
jgi:RimJ/RimL family protein N-acetyltransferase